MTCQAPLENLKKRFLCCNNQWPFLIILKSVLLRGLTDLISCVVFSYGNPCWAPPEQLVLTPLSQDSPLRQDEPVGSNMRPHLADRFEKSECPPQADRCLPLLLGASQVHEATPSYSSHCMDRLIKLTVFHHMHTDMACIRDGRYDVKYCGDDFKCVFLEILCYMLVC